MEFRLYDKLIVRKQCVISQVLSWGVYGRVQIVKLNEIIKVLSLDSEINRADIIGVYN